MYNVFGKYASSTSVTSSAIYLPFPEGNFWLLVGLQPVFDVRPHITSENQDHLLLIYSPFHSKCIEVQVMVQFQQFLGELDPESVPLSNK